LDSQGNFAPEGRHDILIEAVGRPEHCGRVHAAGQGVGIKLYFGVSQRHSSSSPQETKAEMTCKIHVPSCPRALTKVKFKVKSQHMVGPLKGPKEESQRIDHLRRRQDVGIAKRRRRQEEASPR